MIKVSIIEENSELIGIKVNGHANTAEKGKDLVCAGVSSCIFGCTNNLKNPKDFDIQIEDGYFSIMRLTSPINEHDQIVLETLIECLKTLQGANKKSIQIK